MRDKEDTKKAAPPHRRHADEIEGIRLESHQRIVDRALEGRDLLRERRACSAAIAAACHRHREESNEQELAK